MTWHWKDVSVPGLRKVGATIDRPGYVDLVTVANPGPGDVDLSQSKIWRAEHRGHVYVITFDAMHPSMGFRASVKAAGGRKARRDPTYLTDDGPPPRTFAEAEAACHKHARSKLT